MAKLNLKSYIFLKILVFFYKRIYNLKKKSFTWRIKNIWEH